MINFRYRICRLMEFFLDKRIEKKERSMIAVGGHPLPNNWVYPKKLRHADLRLPPCAGGPIPTAYAREEARSVAVVKMVDDNADVEESDEVKNERKDMQEYLILSFVDRTRITKKPLKLYNKAFESWAKQKNKASSKNHQRRKSNFKASWSTYQDRLQDYIQKNEFATNHGVCDECSKMAEKNIVCVHCSVCVHPLPDCCRFYGDQLSCIDCYRRRHVILFVPHAICDGDSSQLLAKKDTASNDVKTPPESNKKARLGEGKKNEDKNVKVAKKDGIAQDLKAAHQSDAAAKKEDDRKPAAVAKKMDDTTLKMKDPPTKRVDEEDQTDDKKPAANENVQDKKKRRNAKLPLHPNSTPLLPKSIGKSPNMDLDLEDTESESDDDILEDKPKPWKLITTLKKKGKFAI
jgi:hypothetical protein